MRLASQVLLNPGSLSLAGIAAHLALEATFDFYKQVWMKRVTTKIARLGAVLASAL
jgi:hypothetical protein